MTQLHQRPRSEASLSDEYETPKNIFDYLNCKYGLNCEMDVSCTEDNCKTPYRLPKGNTLEYHWNNCFNSDVWCNPPQTKCKEFVLKADEQWNKHNINIMMIIPANVLTTNYFAEVIDNVEYYPIKGRITFLVDGKSSPYPARNGYFVVIWRKK